MNVKEETTIKCSLCHLLFVIGYVTNEGPRCEDCICGSEEFKTKIKVIGPEPYKQPVKKEKEEEIFFTLPCIREDGFRKERPFNYYGYK